MRKARIIVVGGGPAGLMAAGCAAAAGVETLLLEKQKTPGRKLCITGKGRCNLTNVAPVDQLIARFGQTGEFLRQTFAQFDNAELMAFLRDNGLPLETERGGRVFPSSGRAKDVLDALLRWISSCGAQLTCSADVTELVVKNGYISAVISGGRRYPCRSVILATGGASYPRTGSTGDGYRVAAAVGHAIVPIRPALVPLVVADELSELLEGVELRNTQVRLLIDGELAGEGFGEVAFTDRGFAGPVALTLSGLAVDALDAERQVEFSLDLKPALDEAKLSARIDRDLAQRGDDRLKSFLRGLLPRQVVSACLRLTGLSGKRAAHSMTDGERQRLVGWLKDFRLTVTGYRPFSEAIITAGGVATHQVDPETMESRLVHGLYIAGELLDVDAATGGYNLQAAFSTGWLAGRSAAAAISNSSKSSKNSKNSKD
jgi:predicted Rossmann fold flavoprotein